MAVKRGDLVTIALSGDYGKLRPALIIQGDPFEALASVTALPLTGELHDWPLFRITIHPAPANGLQKPSQVMIDKAVTIPRTKIGQRIGRIEAEAMMEISTALARFLSLADA